MRPASAQKALRAACSGVSWCSWLSGQGAPNQQTLRAPMSIPPARDGFTTACKTPPSLAEKVGVAHFHRAPLARRCAYFLRTPFTGIAISPLSAM